ncbi:MAG: DMT family transporter [Lachnospiraceae bacterium]|nr:DMT family transporter [Lachnospiraceae bacterium]
MKKNYIYAIVTVLIWSTMATTVKMMLADIPNLEALSISSYLAFIFLLLMNIKTGIIKEMKNYSGKEYGIMSGLGFLGLFLYSALYYYGLGELSSQEACILNYLWPMMLVVFSCIILKEKMTLMKGVAMVCSFVGIIILSAGDRVASSGNTTMGIVSCILAAACYGLFSVLNKKADLNQNISMMISWLVVGICAMALGLITEEWVMLSGKEWLSLLWLGVVVDAVAYLLWALALKGSENTAKIANLAYLTPFLSLIVSAVVLGEKITLRALVALVFIIGGILLQSLCDGKKISS